MNRYILIIALLLFAISIFAEAPNIRESYVLEINGDYPGALQIMQSLASADSSDAFYIVRIAWLQYLSGSYAEALASYQRSAAMQDCIDARVGIINCQLALGNYHEAINLAEIQLKVHKQNPTLLAKAAYGAYMLKDHALAAAYYARSTALYPWDMETRGYLVNNLYLAGKLDEAKAQYRLLQKYYPQSQIITLYKDILD